MNYNLYTIKIHPFEGIIHWILVTYIAVQPSPQSKFKLLPLHHFQNPLYPFCPYAVNHSSPPRQNGDPLSVAVCLPFLEIPYEKNYTISSLLFLASFTSIVFWRFIFAATCISCWLILLLSRIPLYSDNTFCLSVHQTINIWIVSSLSFNK